jgi:methionine-rich copper-binding protein CopC
VKKTAPYVSLVLTVLLSPLFTSASASASTLVSTSPVAGQSLQSAPNSVTITIDAPLLDTGNEITVTDPSGVRVDDGLITVGGNAAVIGLKPLLKGGVYTVTYSMLAENDVPLTGTFTFNFVQASIAPSVAPQPTESGSSVPSGNNVGTTMFVIGLLIAAIIVTVLLARYARKIYSER